MKMSEISDEIRNDFMELDNLNKIDEDRHNMMKGKMDDETLVNQEIKQINLETAKLNIEAFIGLNGNDILKQQWQEIVYALNLEYCHYKKMREIYNNDE
jgi:hypothetical protein